MKINPQAFFNFCARHISLLDALREEAGEISEADVRGRLRFSPDQQNEEEQPAHLWRRLREYQILVPSEPGGDLHYLAEPVRRLLDYLHDEARATTPEVIRGYLQSLESCEKRLDLAIKGEDAAMVRITLEELPQTLRKIQADLDYAKS